MNNNYNTNIFYENPSLIELYNFIKNIYNTLPEYEKNMFDEKTFYVIEYYIYGKITGALHNILNISDKNIKIQETTPQKIFYLGGHINYNTNIPITQNMIDLVQKKINQINMHECYGMEIYSVIEHNERFKNFTIFYNNYKLFIEHIKYSPNNIGYHIAKEHFYNNS